MFDLAYLNTYKNDLHEHCRLTLLLSLSDKPDTQRRVYIRHKYAQCQVGTKSYLKTSVLAIIEYGNLKPNQITERPAKLCPVLGS